MPEVGDIHTQEEAEELLTKVGRRIIGEDFTLNRMKGTEGEFFRGSEEDREIDLREAVMDVLEEREE